MSPLRSVDEHRLYGQAGFQRDGFARAAVSARPRAACRLALVMAALLPALCMSAPAWSQQTLLVSGTIQTPWYAWRGDAYQYAGPYRYLQTFDGLNITDSIGIYFDPDPSLGWDWNPGLRQAYENTVQANIQGLWNYNGSNRCYIQDLTTLATYGCLVNVQFTSRELADLVVRVFPGSGPTNELTWYVNDSPATNAHEFGHMLGLFDEYMGGAIASPASPTESYTGLMGWGVFSQPPYMYRSYYQRDLNFMYQINPAGSYRIGRAAPTGLPGGWSAPGGGDWFNPSNWQGPPPNGANTAALFPDTIDSPSTVTLNQTANVASVEFDSPLGYTISGSGQLAIVTGSGNRGIYVQSTGSHAIAVPINLGPGAFTVRTMTGARLELSGTIYGQGGLVLTDNSWPRIGGLVVMSGANTYSGPTQIYDGALQLTNTLACQNSQVTVTTYANYFDGTFEASGGTWRDGYGTLLLNPLLAYTLGAGSQWSGGAIGYSGTTTITSLPLPYGATIPSTLANPALPGVPTNLFHVGGDPGTTLTVILQVTDNGGTPVAVVKSGGATLVLSNTANSYTGGTSLLGGTLALSNSVQISTGPVFFGGGTLRADATMNCANAILLGLTWGPGGNVDVASGRWLTLSGVVSGGPPGPASVSFALTKTGSGTLILSGPNTYPGVTNISAGTIRLGSALGLGTTTGGTIVAFGATLDLYGQSVLGEPLTLDGRGVGNNGALVNNSVASPASLTGSISLISDATVGGTGNLTLAGTVSGGFALRKSGTGTLVLSGTNTYSGLTTIIQGLVQLGNPAGLGDITSGTTVVTGGPGATLDLNGQTVPDEPLTIGGVGVGGGGALVNNGAADASLAGAVSLSSNASIGGAGRLTLWGALSGGFALSKVGSGTLVLSGANDYTGQTNINQGVLQLGSAAGLGATVGWTTVASGATLDMNGQSVGAEDIYLSGNGVVGGDGALIDGSATDASLAGNISLTSDASVGCLGGLTLAGAISGQGGLNKLGPGTLVLSGTSTYVGSTTVSAGAMLVNGAMTGGGQVIIIAGATLGGSGTVVGAVNSAGGAVSPGSSIGDIGALSVGSLSQDIASVLDIALADTDLGQYDRLVVSGNADLGGILAVNLTGGLSLAPDEQFRIVDVGGALSGQFSGLPEGNRVGVYYAMTLLISYAGGDGNDVVLTTGWAADGNGDGLVDMSDYAAWFNNYGLGGSPGDGDFSGDGQIDMADYALWFNTYGAGGADGVPEPAALSLLAIGSLAALRRKRK